MRPEYMAGPARLSGEGAVFLMALLLTMGAVVGLGWLLFFWRAKCQQKG